MRQSRPHKASQAMHRVVTRVQKLVLEFSRPPEYFAQKLEDHRGFTVVMCLALAVVGSGLWVWDFAIDPIGAHDTLPLRLLFVLLGVAGAVAWATLRSRLALRIVTVAVLVIAIAGFSVILSRLSSSAVDGVEGYVFFCLAVLLVFQGFSARFTIACCVILAALPHAAAGLLENFPLLHYTVFIWPVTCVVAVAVGALSHSYSVRYDVQRELEVMSTTDPLTETANRRAFSPLLEAEVKLSHRRGTRLSLLLIDIDNFKHINDDRGHQSGDTVLKHLADTCRGIVRASDTLARLGGDEFAILLSDTDTGGALVPPGASSPPLKNRPHVLTVRLR